MSEIDSPVMQTALNDILAGSMLYFSLNTNLVAFLWIPCSVISKFLMFSFKNIKKTLQCLYKHNQVYGTATHDVYENDAAS